MKYIKVKAKEGRIARVSPRGEMIPHDEAVRVPLTPYVQRLIHHHKDVIVEKEPKPKVSAPPAPPAETIKDKQKES